MSVGSVCTIVYVVRIDQESLLGPKAGEALGIILIKLEGRKIEKSVREIQNTIKRTVKEGQVVSGGQTQQNINAAMKQIVHQHQRLFVGIG